VRSTRGRLRREALLPGRFDHESAGEAAALRSFVRDAAAVFDRANLDDLVTV